MAWLEVLGWVLVAVLMVAGVAGAVLPVLPGAGLIFAGALLGAWLGDFERVQVWVLVLLGVLGVLSWAVDYVAMALGVRRVGASPLAVRLAALGTIVGIFLGLVGVLVLPFVGAVLGEWWARRHAGQAARAGVAAWLGLVVGALLKLTLSFVMVGVFVLALMF